jgi:hypothetical protein
MNCRGVLANLFAGAIVAAMIPLGCSGAIQDAEPAVVHRQRELPKMPKVASIEVPAATAREMTACVEAMNHQSAEPSHGFQYNLEANGQGKVVKVKLHGSTLREPLLEACFARALAAMDVPEEALRLRGAKPVSGGESTYSSRANVGIVQAAAVPIALAPIVITALGVTIIVGISIDILRNATSEDAERARCRAVNEACQQKCLPKLKHSDFGNQFHRCMRECREAAGCWKGI